MCVPHTHARGSCFEWRMHILTCACGFLLFNVLLVLIEAIYHSINSWYPATQCQFKLYVHFAYVSFNLFTIINKFHSVCIDSIDLEQGAMNSKYLCEQLKREERKNWKCLHNCIDRKKSNSTSLQHRIILSFFRGKVQFAVISWNDLRPNVIINCVEHDAIQSNRSLPLVYLLLLLFFSWQLSHISVQFGRKSRFILCGWHFFYEHYHAHNKYVIAYPFDSSMYFDFIENMVFMTKFP